MAELQLWLCSHVSRALILQLKQDKHSHPTYFSVNICVRDTSAQTPLQIQMQLQEMADSASSTTSPYKEMRRGWILDTHTHTVFNITNIMCKWFNLT